MLRNISILVALVGLGTTFLHADYVVQLGVYKERSTIEKALKRIKDPQLRSDVMIVKRGKVFWAHSKPFADKVSNMQTLKQYRKVFNDAYFRESTLTVKPDETSKKDAVDITDGEALQAKTKAEQDAADIAYWEAVQAKRKAEQEARVAAEAKKTE